MVLPNLCCLTSSVIKSVIIVVTKKRVLNVVFGYFYNFKDSAITWWGTSSSCWTSYYDFIYSWSKL